MGFYSLSGLKIIGPDSAVFLIVHLERLKNQGIKFFDLKTIALGRIFVISETSAV